MLVEIHPPVTPPWWWWLVVAALGLAGLALATLSTLAWRRTPRPAPAGPDVAAEARSAALSAIALAEADHAAGTCPAAPAVRRMGRSAREFVGIVGPLAADVLTAGQLREAAREDPRLRGLAALADVVESSFGDRAEPDVAAVAHRARTVVAQWS